MKPRRGLFQTFAALGILVLCLSGFSVIKFSALHGISTTDGKDEHTIPTLLSVVDEKTGKYIYALDNPLYENLKNAAFVNDYLFEDEAKEKLDDIPTIELDRDTMFLREPLRLSWTMGRTKNGDPVLNEEDIVVLYCGENVAEPDANYKKITDAATISQIKATAHKYYQEAALLSVQNASFSIGDTINEWYIPSFPVTRQNACQFALYKSLPEYTYALMGFSQLLHILDGNSMPTGIHVALGNRVDEMTVNFKTGVNGGRPVVQYGLKKDSMLLSATGTSHTYKAQDMCQKPATQEEPGKFIPPGMLHVVTLTQLKPNTTYYYKVASKHEGQVNPLWSETYSFVSPPEVKANSEPFSYIVYGDQGCPSLGWGKGGAWCAKMATREIDNPQGSPAIRAVHHFGDLSYARGAAHIWDEWLNMISPFTTRVPLMVSVGNHEYDHTKGGENGKDPSGMPTPGGYHPKWGNFDKDSGGECGVPTANHFTMPNTHGNSNGVFWYSYDFASVHTTVISSEHDLSPGSPQYNWLVGDLKSVDRAKTPWLVVELHRPMYESEAEPLNTLVGVEMRHRIEHLLKDYGVDLVLAGHYHTYLRTCRGLYKSKCGNGGPTHITVGSAGARLTHGHVYPSSSHWTQKHIKGVYGYGRITIANSSALHFEFVQAGDETDTNAGLVLDDMWIIKDGPSKRSFHGGYEDVV